MDVYIEIAEAIKKEVGQILSRNLEMDVLEDEYGTMRQARWNRARVEIGQAIDRNLIGEDGDRYSAMSVKSR